MCEKNHILFRCNDDWNAHVFIFFVFSQLVEKQCWKLEVRVKRNHHLSGRKLQNTKKRWSIMTTTKTMWYRAHLLPRLFLQSHHLLLVPTPYLMMMMIFPLMNFDFAMNMLRYGYHAHFFSQCNIHSAMLHVQSINFCLYSTSTISNNM